MIKIIGIKKTTVSASENPHVAIEFFRWVDESSQGTGETTRLNMYDWVANKKGQAYIRDAQGNPTYVFANVSPSGQPYLQTIKDGAWTDDLLKIPEY